MEVQGIRSPSMGEVYPPLGGADKLSSVCPWPRGWRYGLVGGTDKPTSFVRDKEARPRKLQKKTKGAFAYAS